MPKVSNLPAYDGDQLDGTESIPLVEDDESQTERITIDQLFGNVPDNAIPGSGLATDAVGSSELDLSQNYTLTGNIDTTGGQLRPGTIYDTNGNEQVALSQVASAVNHPQLSNAASGNAVQITSAGSDVNIDLVLTGKGTGGLVPQIPGDTGGGPLAIGGDHGASVGDQSVAIGKGARTLEDTGGSLANNHPRSTVVGFEAGNKTGTGVFGLTAQGYQAARNNTGSKVTASGFGAARDNTGDFVTITGYQAALDNTGIRVTASGYQTARNNLGDDVTASGYRAAESNSGDKVTARGVGAAESNSGARLTASGYQAAQSNTGIDVTASGYRAALNNTQDEVTAVGFSAVRGDGITASNMGARVTGIGRDALRDNVGDDTIGLGYNAGGSNTGNDSVLIGRGAGENNSTASQFILAQTHVNATPLIQGDFSTAQVGFGTTPSFGVHHTGGSYTHLGAPASSPTTADMDNGSVIFWLDETNDDLEVAAKKSDGTVITGTVTLS